ncbi:hypothetical protein [Mesorhizobium sp. WSM2561]|uniref:hypothetical protein n=1 Tax=Mesorhizobium sp. WSM2561 TaxID=1040985 RepID=UPI0004823D6C|nr:hypothetical protein [Mesorhizobium sp. WSM2561]
MKARPIRITGSKEDGFLIHVPLGRSGTDEATVDLDDYNELVGLKLSRNWQLRGGQVGALAPFGTEVLIARVLTDARPGQRVVYLDNNTQNLRRNNLGLQAWGGSSKHDRALLVEAAAELEKQNVLAKEAGSYHPRFRKPVIFRPDRVEKSRRKGRVVFSADTGSGLTMSFHHAPTSFYPEVAEPAVGPVFESRNGEKAYDYQAVITVLNRDWRVIQCKDGIQWILQRRKGQFEGKPAWKGRSYCRSKGGLVRSIRDHAGEIGEASLKTVEALPEWI